MSTPHVVALVGGYASMAANFELHLAEWGIEVIQHFEYLPIKVPSKATMIIVLKSACCHKLSDTAQLVAAKRQIPLVVVDHHWTLAEGVLLQNGILSQVKTPSVDESDPHWLDARVADLDREVARLRENLSQAEDLILEQRGLLDELRLVTGQNTEILHGIQRDISDPRHAMTLKELRRYATYEIGLTGASKIRGGKAALLRQIQQMGGSTPTPHP